MKNETRAFISQLTKNIISLYEIAIPINNIDSVVSKIGGTIAEEENFNKQHDGSIKKTSEDSFQILISKNQSPENRNFTLAGELGHLFLHMGYGINDSFWQSQKESECRIFGESAQVYQANEFAYNLLMPGEEYIRYFRDHYTGVFDNDIKAVAKYFNVSISAAINRGKFLGYLN